MSKQFKSSKAMKASGGPEKEVPKLEDNLIPVTFNIDFKKLYSLLEKLMAGQEQNKEEIDALRTSFTTFRDECNFQERIHEANQKIMENTISLENLQTKCVDIETNLSEFKTNTSDNVAHLIEADKEMLDQLHDTKKQLENYIRQGRRGGDHYEITPRSNLIEKESPETDEEIEEEHPEEEEENEDENNATPKQSSKNAQSIQLNTEENKEENPVLDLTSPTSKKDKSVSQKNIKSPKDRSTKSKESTLELAKKIKNETVAEIDEKLGKIQKALMQELNLLKSQMDSKFYEIEGKMDFPDSDNDDDLFKKKGFNFGAAKPMPHESKEIAIGDDTPIRQHKKIPIDTANELFRRYAFIKEEIKKYKRIMLQSIDEADEEEAEAQFKKNYITYQQRFIDLEEFSEKMNENTALLQDKVRRTARNFALLEKHLNRLKIKIKLEEMDEELPPVHLPELTSPHSGSKSPSHRPPVKKDVISPISTTSIKTDDLQNILTPMRQEMSKFVSMDTVSKLQQDIKYILNILNAKLEKKDITHVEKLFNAELSKLSQSLIKFPDFKMTVEKTIQEIFSNNDTTQVEIGKLKEKTEKLENLVGKIEFKLDDLNERVNAKAASLDMNNLKDMMDRTSEKLDRLCILLDQGAEPSQDNSPTNERKTTNLPLLIMSVENRVNDFEDRILKIEENFGIQELDNQEEEKFNEPILLVENQDMPHPQIKTQLGPTKGFDFNSLKNLVAKHQLDISYLRDKLLELDNLFSDNTKGKIYADLREEIKQIIDSNNENLNETLKNTFESKADFEMIQSYVSQLDKKVIHSLNSKIDKIDLRKAQAQLRRKMDSLEHNMKKRKSVEGLSHRDMQLGPIPLMLYNQKCFFCNQEVKISPELLHQIEQKYSPLKYEAQEFGARLPKFGAGFSKVLSHMKKPPIVIEGEHEMLKSASRPEIGFKAGLTDEKIKKKEIHSIRKIKDSIQSRTGYGGGNFQTPVHSNKYDAKAYRSEEGSSTLIPNALRLAPMQKTKKF